MKLYDIRINLSVPMETTTACEQSSIRCNYRYTSAKTFARLYKNMMQQAVTTVSVFKPVPPRISGGGREGGARDPITIDIRHETGFVSHAVTVNSRELVITGLQDSGSFAMTYLYLESVMAA